uniref:N-terminal methionine N(alpha)-acetyltransferase NatE n=1 Tax=Meloidogyne enterolobii TaxID=390850 RepID=A0A6V7UZR1_MELEN|nr:unnamed protein product [Meloidogyne enterolobii]
MENSNENDTENDGTERRKISILDLELIAPNKQIIKQLILLNSIALPINFGDINSLHYKQVLKNELAIKGVERVDDEDELKTKYWTIMAYYKNALVGAITVCIETIYSQKENNSKKCLYILTLAVIPSFRRRGVASILVLDTINYFKHKWKNIKQIALHCQSCNEPALAFYQKLGFVQTEFIANYYLIWRIVKPDAYRLEFFYLKEEEKEGNK